MTPEALFQIANPIVLIGWIALIFAPLAPRLTDLIASTIIPLILATAYAALILAFWSGAPGGYGSLPDVMALLSNPHIALAGWVHYLAFDLFVGAWATRTARTKTIPHLIVLPNLVLIFLFGPAGYLTFSAIRAAYALRARMTKASR